MCVLYMCVWDGVSEGYIWGFWGNGAWDDVFKDGVWGWYVEDYAWGWCVGMVCGMVWGMLCLEMVCMWMVCLGMVSGTVLGDSVGNNVFGG